MMYRGVKFSFVLNVGLLSLVYLIGTMEASISFNSTYFTTIRFPDPLMSINPDIVSETKIVPSVLRCSMHCAKSGSRSLYFEESDSVCHCNDAADLRFDTGAEVPESTSTLVYGYNTKQVDVDTRDDFPKYYIHPYWENCFELFQRGFRVDADYVEKFSAGSSRSIFCNLGSTVEHYAKDCLQLFTYGFTDDGVYKIELSNSKVIEVSCDQSGGGWTIIQQRQEGKVDFYREWDTYVNGFGNFYREFWLGLEAIHLLTDGSAHTLRIDMEAFEDVLPKTAFAEYNEFHVSAASDKYRLSIDGFTGDCNDSMAYQNGMMFSTKYHDNDLNTGANGEANCAVLGRGGWWYNWCYQSNLNGRFHGGATDKSSGIVWETCWGLFYSMKSCSMKIKRQP